MNTELVLITQEGEGYQVEFKETLGHLDREIVAFAYSMGGSIYLGIKDSGEISGISTNNGLKSQIMDIARNCDPSIRVDLVVHAQEHVLEIIIREGPDKPYRFREGFFLRIGPSTQKLKRDEIIQLINDAGKIRFDETLNKSFHYPDDFSMEAFADFLQRCQIQTNASVEDVLLSLNTAVEDRGQLRLKNAAVLFFAKQTQHFFPEAYISVVSYKSSDRFSILEKQDIMGNPIHQIEHDSSHTYIHVYPNRIEIENPGGLHRGLTLENLDKRSARRNRLIADLLHRAHYIERVGSGFDRMYRTLEENNNPPLEISATNFFDIRFYKRISDQRLVHLSERQREIYHILFEKSKMGKAQLAKLFNVSDDTILRDLNELIEEDLVVRLGTGRASVYQLKK